MKKKHDHYLKILPEYFEVVADGTKRFEIRKDDRGFEVGDTVFLCEWIPDDDFTGKAVKVVIKYVLRDCYEYGLRDGYCVFGWDQGYLIGPGIFGGEVIGRLL